MCLHHSIFQGQGKQRLGHASCLVRRPSWPLVSQGDQIVQPVSDSSHLIVLKTPFRKVSAKTEIRESKDILDGKPHISSKNLFIMVIDPRHAGDRCRFKMHYTGCSKKDKKGECLKVFNDKFVEAKRQTQKVSGKVRAMNPKKINRKLNAGKHVIVKPKKSIKPKFKFPKTQ